MKKKNTRKALFGSVLATLIALTLLIGTTFAWFTDKAESTNNLIQAGNLKVDLLYSKTDVEADYTSVKAGEGPIFNYKHWEPGYTDVKYVQVVNEGTLALKYELNIFPTQEVGALAQVIDVYYYAPADGQAMPPVGDSFDPTTLAAYKLGTLADVIAANAPLARGILLPAADVQAPIVVPPADAEATRRGSTKALIVLHMQETAGNEYQGATIGGSFDIQLNATQVEYEKDSFDHKYDAEAGFPAVPRGPIVLNESGEQNGTYGGESAYIVPSGSYQGDFVVQANETVPQIVISGVEADVNNFIVFNKENTVWILNCDITLPAGGWLVTGSPYYPSQVNIVSGTVKVNGTVVTDDNKWQYVDNSAIGTVWVH